MLTSLILPCYNPQPGWDATICREYTAFCKAIGATATELIIVFDGSSSNVTEVQLQAIRSTVPDVIFVFNDVNRGKGYATRAGVSKASGDIIIYTDVDFPYTTKSMAQIYAKLAAHECDLAVGVKDAAYYSHVPPVRRIISRGLRLFTGALLSMPVTDTQCGLKGFRRSVAATFLSTTIDRYLFDLEFVYKAFHRSGIKVLAVPVALKDNIVFRSMNYQILLPEMLNFLKIFFNRGR